MLNKHRGNTQQQLFIYIFIVHLFILDTSSNKNVLYFTGRQDTITDKETTDTLTNLYF